MTRRLHHHDRLDHGGEDEHPAGKRQRGEAEEEKQEEDRRLETRLEREEGEEDEDGQEDSCRVGDTGHTDQLEGGSIRRAGSDKWARLQAGRLQA